MIANDCQLTSRSLSGIRRVGRDAHHGLLGDGGPPFPCRGRRVTLDVEQRQERLALHAFRLRELTEIQQRRHDVDRFDHFVHARPARHPARPSEEERDVRELAVDAVAVPHPPVIVELLAVVAHEHDCGLIVEAVRAQPLEEPRDFGVEPRMAPSYQSLS